MKKPLLSKKRIIILLGGIILLLLIFSWLAPAKENNEYQTATVTKQDIKQEILAIGQLKPFKRVTVGAQVSGEIKKLPIKVGDKVNQGDLIAEIDPRLSQNALNKAKDTLLSEQTNLNTLLRKQTVAKRELQSYTALYKQTAVSKSEYDKYITAYQEISNAIIQTKANINKAKLDVDTGITNLSYTKITAPISGVIISLPVEEGQTLTAGFNTPTIASIAELDKMTIKAQISEADVFNVKPDLNATFSIMGDNEKTYPAVVDVVHPAPTYIADNANPSGSTYYYTTLNVTNVEPNFRVDMTVNVRIIVAEKKNVLAIANSAINNQDDKLLVKLINKKGKITETEITSGFTNGILTEIKSGLAEGDTIVTTTIKKE